MAKKKKLTFAQLRRKRTEEDRRDGMIEIKRLTKKYGRTTIQYCLNQLKELEKKRNRLTQIKREADRLEREIG